MNWKCFLFGHKKEVAEDIIKRRFNRCARCKTKLPYDGLIVNQNCYNNFMLLSFHLDTFENKYNIRVNSLSSLRLETKIIRFHGECIDKYSEWVSGNRSNTIVYQFITIDSVNRRHFIRHNTISLIALNSTVLEDLTSTADMVARDVFACYNNAVMIAKKDMTTDFYINDIRQLRPMNVPAAKELNHDALPVEIEYV